MQVYARRSSALKQTLLSSWRPYATVSPSLAAPIPAATDRAQATLKRFWKDVDIEDREGGYAITLDKKPLRTPSGNLLIVPPTKTLVATLIAAEWHNQETVLRSHALPMTSIVARAIDSARNDKTRSDIRSALIRYLETDTICFHQLEPETLVSLQESHWNPILDWVRSEYDVSVNTYYSVLSSSQPKETMVKLNKAVSQLDSWQLAAMERAVLSTKSFITALALVRRQITAEQAAQAAQVEVNSQIDKWGEVEDSHDVEHHDVRRMLGSAACLLTNI